MTHEKVLDVQGVDFVREGKLLLDHIDLAVSRGEHWALIGPNGAGKTTLLNLCGAVNHPTRGTVHVLGRQLGRVDMRELRRDIGFVNPRHPLRSNLTVEQIVLTGATGTNGWSRAGSPPMTNATEPTCS
ncbi:ATP-binding cassette domain-containing protein [Aeromicrobium sp. UC242_57]|uniref:ATP-binding cassette domain-containing protein n=1 Tax=Aeromicrobium sp. UC242_57 TaxID=3374624 RepID=UPI00378B2B17